MMKGGLKAVGQGRGVILYEGTEVAYVQKERLIKPKALEGSGDRWVVGGWC
jgi:hypothetical protein